VEHRHGRAWPDLLRRRQQSLCFSTACRNTYAYTHRYCHSHCNIYSYGHVNSDGNGHADSYSYVNAYGNGSA
jgi:hypothetical protein